MVLIVAALTVGACASSTAPSPTAEPSPSSTPSASASASPSAGTIDLGAIPTACIGLGAADCQRVIAEIGELVPPGTAATYIQVGPFGCADAQPCAPTLTGRPEGDVTIEAGVGALSWHIKAAAGGGPLTIDQQDAFGVLVAPTSQGPVTAGARPFTLGHCGLGSGIDAGGSWWDPVGQVDGDHPDAINAAEGILAITDPDNATFTSTGGFTVQLVRRDGEKYLPACM